MERKKRKSSPITRNNSTPSRKGQTNPFEKYRYELSEVVDDQLGYQNRTDFWNFLSKYVILTVKCKHRGDRKRTELISFEIKSDVIENFYRKLPQFDRFGKPLKLSHSEFVEFMEIVLVYIDFKQKANYRKLQQLRKEQRDLPVAQYRQQITDAVKNERVVLVAGDTGCGKSTQIPRYIYEAGFDKVVCTQPRRIACISLAKRVAYETLTQYSTTVGYKIRFEGTKRKTTNIIFTTEGLLLRQASDEDIIFSYDVIILDEIHERHLFGDFLIGIMKCLLYKEMKVKIVLMSATINIKLFSEYFAGENVKVIQVPGRLYPIEIIYRPIIKNTFEKNLKRFNSTPYLQVLQIIDEKYQGNQRGDVLIFLSGIADIFALADAVTEYSSEKKNWIVLPLHSSLSLAEQDKVFAAPPDGVRKCIISTNIAETSVTIDGIRFVIDSGKVNRMCYYTMGAINKLTEVSISQDSAKQRSGRAGRTGPGMCYRLYSEQEYNNFEPFTLAEIHSVPLEDLILHMISLGVTEVERFPFLERPCQSAIVEAMERLLIQEALTKDDSGLTMTSLGEALSKLPVDMRIGKMLIISTVFGIVNSVLVLASILSVQSPFTVKAYRDGECENLRKPLESNHGDPITLLNIYKEWLNIKYRVKPTSHDKSKHENSWQWAKKRGIEEQRLYEVTKLRVQFRDILQESNLLPKPEEEKLSSAQRSIDYGELKVLKSMRYKLKNEELSFSRKKLKYNSNIFDNDEEEDNRIDLRDIEFRISNDINNLEKLLNEISVRSHKDLTILKLVLCSGLYPQIALPDDHSYRGQQDGSDFLFHTKHKNFVSLHPMGYFANNPQSLKLSDDEIEVPPAGYFSKNPLSSNHQILIYQSLLETTKVYLMNTMRMPALHTLLLFSKDIHTNEIITKIAFDQFIMCDIPYVGQGKTLLLKALKLRDEWRNILDKKLTGTYSEQDEHKAHSLIYDLAEYMKMRVTYNMKMLLKADLKTMYMCVPNDDVLNDLTVNPFKEDFQPIINTELGGVWVTENVVYKCLIEDEYSLTVLDEVSSPFTCPKCDCEINGSFLYKLGHEVQCRKVTEQRLEPPSKRKKSKHNAQVYNCSTCKQELELTPVEILRHKNECK